MLRHVVMYKLKSEFKGKEQQLADRFLSMNGKIPQLKSVFSGVDIINSDRSFDVVLICDFCSKEDLEGYLAHPYHQQVRTFVHSVVEKAHSVDYIF